MSWEWILALVFVYIAFIRPISKWMDALGADVREIRLILEKRLGPADDDDLDDPAP